MTIWTRPSGRLTRYSPPALAPSRCSDWENTELLKPSSFTPYWYCKEKRLSGHFSKKILYAQMKLLTKDTHVVHRRQIRVGFNCDNRSGSILKIIIGKTVRKKIFWKCVSPVAGQWHTRARMRRAPTGEKGDKTSVFENTSRSTRERGINQTCFYKNNFYVMSGQAVCVSNTSTNDLICKVCTIEFLGHVDQCWGGSQKLKSLKNCCC